MHYTFTMPPASRAADQPAQIDDALVARARHALADAVAALPPGATLNGVIGRSLFAIPMSEFCRAAGHQSMPVEKLIVAIKLAWASLAESRLRFGEAAPDALSAAVSACIEAYYDTDAGARV